jgi:hypothetical protein
MTRSILAALAAAAVVAVLSGTGCQPGGVGDPCTPEAEYNPSFLGFDVKEVNTESESFQCLTRLCLVNHFQGRVSCPYGQQPNGQPRPGAASCNGKSPGAGCCVPGTTGAIDGVDKSACNPQNTSCFLDPKAQATVEPQCTDRTADKAVYCSCRCANVDGQTNDGRNYCTCPDGFECKQLVSSIGQGDQGLTGGYCIKKGTEYNADNTCGLECGGQLNPSSNPAYAITMKNCGTAQGVKP